MRKWGFFKWTRDNQKRFADEVAAELDSKASRETVDNLLAGSVSKTGDTMTGRLVIKIPPKKDALPYPLVFKAQYMEEHLEYTWYVGPCSIGPIFYIKHGNTNLIGIADPLGFFSENPNFTLGYLERPWAKTFTKVLNNGTKNADIEIPTKGGTMALVSDIEDILRQHGLIPPETTEQTEQQQGVENA